MKRLLDIFFHDPFIVKMYSPDEPVVLSEETGVEGAHDKTKEISSKIGITFYPWVPLSADSKIPCSADWVITITEPLDNLRQLYKEKIDGRQNNQPQQENDGTRIWVHPQQQLQLPQLKDLCHQLLAP